MTLFENLKTFSHPIIHQTYQTLNLIEISSRALISNFNFFQKLHPEAKICPVLKSNAYGHGLRSIARFIDQKIKPEFICVDSLYEAYELEKERIRTPILILGYTFPANFEIAKRLNFSFPVYDEETVATLSRYQRQASVHIKVDTGMNRLGVRPKDINKFISLLKKYPRLKIEGIYSHLAQVADSGGKRETIKQVETFKNIVGLFEGAGFHFKWKHISATAGALQLFDPEFNLIRLGIGFYGLSPFGANVQYDLELAKNLQPALRMITYLVQVETLKEGDAVSYDGTFVARKKMKIGILPLGYYDGLDRRLSNRGMVEIDGVECRILGRVCMNVTIVDVSQVKNPAIGQKVTVFSAHPFSSNNLTQSARLAKTIPYDLLVHLSPTIRRVLV